MLKLSPGEYFGGILRRIELSGSPLTLTAYPPGDCCPWHVHELPTLFVLLCGHHHSENGQRCFDQPPLTVAFHPTVGPHATFAGPAGMVGINLELTDEWLDRCQLRQSNLVIEYRLLDSVHIRLLALRLAAMSCGSAAPDAAAVETVAMELVSCLVRQNAPVQRAPQWIKRAEEFLREHACTPGASLREVAADAGMHPVYCARAFRRALGCTVSTYIQALRLAEAGRLIMDRRCTLAEVALRVGFADQAHLTRMCSRQLGFTPGRLQRMRSGWPGAEGSTCSRNRRRRRLWSTDS